MRAAGQLVLRVPCRAALTAHRHGRHVGMGVWALAVCRIRRCRRADHDVTPVVVQDAVHVVSKCQSRAAWQARGRRVARCRRLDSSAGEAAAPGGIAAAYVGSAAVLLPSFAGHQGAAMATWYRPDSWGLLGHLLSFNIPYDLSCSCWFYVMALLQSLAAPPVHVHDFGGYV